MEAIGACGRRAHCCCDSMAVRTTCLHFQPTNCCSYFVPLPTPAGGPDHTVHPSGAAGSLRRCQELGFPGRLCRVSLQLLPLPVAAWDAAAAAADAAAGCCLGCCCRACPNPAWKPWKPALSGAACRLQGNNKASKDLTKLAWVNRRSWRGERRIYVSGLPLGSRAQRPCCKACSSLRLPSAGCVCFRAVGVKPPPLTAPPLCRSTAPAHSGLGSGTSWALHKTPSRGDPQWRWPTPAVRWSAT